MDIAIIGGGAAGMISAYLLDKAGHRVTVFEREAVLGGNIRTANKNLSINGLPDDLFLEGGVVEFPEAFVHFKAFLDELKVRRVPIPVGSSIFSADGDKIMSFGAIRRNWSGWRKVAAGFRFAAVKSTALPLMWKARSRNAVWHGKSMDDILTMNGIAKTWIENFTMYSYSIPFPHCPDIPAALFVPALGNYIGSKWFRIEGGVYSYFEKILEKFSGRVICNSDIKQVRRNETGVEIDRQESTANYDKVVIATTPDQVLKLLADPTPEEVRRFQSWKANIAETVIHTDHSIYRKYGIEHPSEFDFFETDRGWGYNACLNGLCAVKGDTTYSLAFNLESVIDPDKIIHVQRHHTPFYQVDAFEFRDEIITANGENHTFYAGAYLGDGLHEGACISAMRVAELLR